MNCDETREQLAGLDRHEPLPDDVTVHLQSCPACRKIWEQSREVEAAGVSAGETDPRMVELVMQRIAEAPSPVYHAETDENRQAYQDGGVARPALWAFGGTLLLVGLVAVRFSRTFQYLVAGPMGQRIDLSVTLAIGATLLAYMAVFVTGNARRIHQAVFGVAEDEEIGRDVQP